MELKRMPRAWRFSPAVRIAVIYAVISALWILFSDRILAGVADDPAQIARLQTAKGWFFVAVSSTLIWWLIHKDFSIRSKLERHIQRSEYRYRRIVENTGQGIWMLDADGRTVLINHWFAEVLEWDLGMATGMPPQRWLDGSLWNTARRLYRRVRSGQRVSLEMRAQGKTLLVSLVPLYAPDGGFDGTVAVITDIDELADARDRLSAAVDRQARMLHEIHHRVRNNLQLVVSMLNLYSQEQLSPEVAGFVRRSEAWLRTLAGAYHLAYESESLRHIPMEQYIHEVAQSLGVYGNSLALQLPDLELPLEEGVVIGLLLNQLLSAGLEQGSTRLELQSEYTETVIRLFLRGLKSPSEEWMDDLVGSPLVSGMAAQIGGKIYLSEARHIIVEFPLNDV